MELNTLRVIQWNLEKTKGQGTGKICSLYRGFVTSRFFSTYFTITGVKIPWVPETFLARIPVSVKSLW